MMPSPALQSAVRANNPAFAYRVAEQRAAALEVKFSRGPAKVLQSTRAPAQLSLFDRPPGPR